MTVTLITFLDTEECQQRLEASIMFHISEIVATMANPIQDPNRVLFKVRIISNFRFQIQQKNVFRYQLKPVFVGHLKPFCGGTKIKGSFRAARSLSVSKFLVLGLILLLLISALFASSINLFPIVSLIGLLLLILFFEKLGKQWSNQDEQILIDFLCDILDVVSAEELDN